MRQGQRGGSLAGLAYAELTVDKQNHKVSCLCGETKKGVEKDRNLPKPLSLGKHMAGCSICSHPREGPMICTLSNQTRCPWCHNNH